jgi:type II secretory pathway component GspD/PulD (secretin)
MRAGMVCLGLGFLALVSLDAIAQEVPAEPEIQILRDGAIKTKGLVTRYWQVNYEEPAAILKELQTYVGKDVKVSATSMNILRIQAPAEKWPIIEQLLDVLDVPAPQVYVEAKIIEIKYDSNLEFGFEGSYDRRAATDGAQPFFGAFTGAFNPESYIESLGTGSPWQGGTFDFKTVGDSVLKHGEYTYIFRALQSRGMVEILSQPSIIAMQGKKASITTGLKFPVQSVEVKGTQTYVTTKFEQTGITLDIEPKLIGRNYVSLSINASDSQITDYVQGPEGSQNPVIAQRSAKTDVSVRDGETIIIGGLLSSSTLESKVGLPLISDIPLIGYLFSSVKSQEIKAELVFFITPRIIKRKEQTVILPPGERSRVNR